MAAKSKRMFFLIFVSLLVQSFSTVLMKYASNALNAIGEKGYTLTGIVAYIEKDGFWQYLKVLMPFVLYFVGSIVVLMVFSVMWQLLLEKMALNSAYLRKGIYYILVLLWSWILFDEKITVWNCIGSVIIVIGMIVAGTEGEKE